MSISDLSSLLAAIEQGVQPQYLFFWGHHPRPDGSIGKECLSQWYAAAFEIDGIHYPTAEHYMMAEKARLFGDLDACENILRAGHPQEAKSLGAGVRGFDEDTWTRNRFEIVLRGNQAKFSQNPPLREFLKQTGNRVLVEASPYDCIWGIGLSASDTRAADPRQWRGLNLLGFALMKVREEL